MIYFDSRKQTQGNPHLVEYKYMDMAWWIFSQGIPITSKELSIQYDITVKQAVDSLRAIKRRKDIIHFTEGTKCLKKARLATIHITNIHNDTVSNNRKTCKRIERDDKVKMLWRFLLSR